MIPEANVSPTLDSLTKVYLHVLLACDDNAQLHVGAYASLTNTSGTLTLICMGAVAAELGLAVLDWKNGVMGRLGAVPDPWDLLGGSCSVSQVYQYFSQSMDVRPPFAFLELAFFQ